MKKFYISGALAIFSLFNFHGQAQQKLAKELVIVNGGSSNVAEYDPTTENYQVFGSISSTSTQDVIVDGKYAFVAAVDSIVKFDLVSNQRVAAEACAGVTEFAVHNGKLIVVKGFGASSNFVEIRDMNDLSLTGIFSSVDDQCSDIAIANDTAYVTMPGSWGTTIGRVAVVDLANEVFVRIDTLGGNGQGVGNIYQSDNSIYTISDHGWGASDFSIHEYDRSTMMWTETVLTGTVNGYSGSLMKGDSLFLSIDDTTKILNVPSYSVVDNEFTTKVLSTLLYDDVADRYYGTQQNYVSNGQAYIFETTGTIADSFTVGIAAEAMEMAYNYVPVAMDDKSYTLKDESIEFDNQGNDSDVEDLNLTFSVITQPTQGSSFIVFGDHASYTPNTGFVGEDSLQYSIKDSWGDSATAWAYVRVVEEINTTVVTFEDFNLGTDEYVNGSDLWGGFIANGAFFENSYNVSWGSWSGFAYSTVDDTLTPGWSNQYACIAGEGSLGSATFGLANGTEGDIVVNSNDGGQTINGVYITNSTYAALSMKDGDSFAKKFGGADGNDPDYFRVKFYGFDDDDDLTDSLEFYLADYRFADNSQDYILTDWAYVDLTPLGNVNSIQYKLESTDVGSFGMNTPSYFCLDNLNDVPPTGIAERNTENEWRVFPNPVQNELTVFNGKAFDDEVQIKVVSLNGRLVMNNTYYGSSIQVQLGDLANGVYSVIIEHQDRTEIHKIVKQ